MEKAKRRNTSVPVAARPVAAHRKSKIDRSSRHLTCQFILVLLLTSLAVCDSTQYQNPQGKPGPASVSSPSSPPNKIRSSAVIRERVQQSPGKLDEIQIDFTQIKPQIVGIGNCELEKMWVHTIQGGILSSNDAGKQWANIAWVGAKTAPRVGGALA